MSSEVCYHLLGRSPKTNNGPPYMMITFIFSLFESNLHIGGVFFFILLLCLRLTFSGLEMANALLGTLACF